MTSTQERSMDPDQPYLNVLLAGAAAVAIANVAWGLDVADLVPVWTSKGKQLARDRAAQSVPDEMVRIPAGAFLMGSKKRVDRNAEAFDIDKYEVNALQFLKFVMATNRPSLLDWRYDGGNYQAGMAKHPVMHVTPLRQDLLSLLE